MGDRVSLYPHARDCAPCRAALVASEGVDTDLRATVHRAAAKLPTHPARLSGPLRVVATPTGRLAASGALLLSLPLVAGLVGSRLFATPHVPVPLLPTTRPALATGWLLLHGPEGLSALDLETGKPRLVLEGPRGQHAQFLLSPARQRLVNWSGWTAETGIEASTVYTLDGTRVHSRSWEEHGRSTYLALRLRHFTQPDPNRSAYDTIVVLPATDLTQRVEVARGTPGDGLAWAPDGHWLAFGLRGRVALAARDGRGLTYLSQPEAHATYPLWVGPDEVWFALGEGEASHVARATVR